MRRLCAVSVCSVLVAGLLAVSPAAAARAGAASAAVKPPPPPLPSAAPSAAGLQKPLGDFRDPPTLDPATGARAGLAAKPDETPKGGHLVAQTETSDTYALGGGKFQVRAHSRPVNWRDQGGVFHRLDLTLAKGPDGRWRPRSAPPGASFADAAPAGGSKVPAGRTVRLDGARWSVGFDLAGSPPLSASVASGAVSYGVGGGVSLVEQPSPAGGVKEAIRLASPPVLPGDGSYTFALDLSGVVPSVDAGGTIVFSTPDGKVAATVPAGVAVDSRAPTPAVSPVAMALVGGPGAWALKVTAPAAWLADPARVYPVSIDPSLQFGRGGSTAQQDAWVYNAAPNTNYSGAAQWAPPLGNYVDSVANQGSDQLRTFLKWNLSSLIGTGKGISSAQLTMSALSAAPTTGVPLAVYPLSSDFSVSTVTWNNQPSWTGNGETLSAAPAGGQATAQLVNEVTGWANGQLPTFNGWADMVIYNPGFTAGSAYFGAMSATGGVDPMLQITYTDLPPATVTSPPNLQSCLHPDHSFSAVCPPTVVGTTSPTITLSQPGNPAGHTLSYWYEIIDGKNLATIPANGDYGIWVRSGWLPSTSWTPPAGSLLDAASYSLYVYTMVDGVMDQPAINTFKVRLPQPAVTPTDSAGPVSLNLATGSPSVSLASRGFPATSGAVSVGLDYDPQRATAGLKGSYFNNCNGATNPWPSPALSRTDPEVSFYWGNDPVYGTPAYGTVAPGSYCAQWTGFVTVPYSGVWQFGASAVGDGIMIQVGSTWVLSDWADHSATNEFCTGASPAAACNQTLQAGVGYPIAINYYHHVNVGQFQLAAKGPINADGSSAPGQLNQVAVPAPWLTPPGRPLPAGWRLSTPTDGAAYTSATFTATGVILNQPSGPGMSYTWNGTTYQPPEGETAALRWVTEAGASVLKVADGDVTYSFDLTGKLLSTVAGADLRTPTSPSYTYDPASGQPTKVTDPVSGRHLDVAYGADPACHVTASGFDADAPAGMACKIALPDGSTDRLYYTSGRFTRLVTSIPAGSNNPFGGNITDMGYDTQSRLVSLRDPLGSDQVAAGTAAADTTSATVINYDPATGKITSLTAPKAQAGATNRVTHSYEYTSATETRVHVAGYAEPPGAPWARKTAFDTNGRVTTDTDPANLATTTAYDTLDDPLTVTTPAGMRTNTFYDPQGKPTDSYGPAAVALFDSTDHPGPGNTARVPHSATGYDEGLHGLAAEYYNSTDLSGAPVARGLAVGVGANNFYNSYPASPAPGVNPANWSARYTGRITWPTTGAYYLNLASAGGARLYLDGALIDDAWTAHTASWTNATLAWYATAGTTARVEIDYYNTTYTPGLVQLGWSGAQGGDIPTADLAPDLGLKTSTTDADGRKTATEYARPELGTVSATVADPAGLALRTTRSSDGLLRPTGQRLPANSYPQAVRADNPAGYWRLDDHTYETAADASGHNLGGSYSGPGVTLAQPSALVADDNPSAAFNGTTGTATIADNPALRLDRTGAFSVEAWVNTTSTAVQAVASKMANAAPYTGWEVSLNAGKPYLQLINTWTSSTIERSGNINLADGAWHHLVVTYDGSSQAAGAKFYEDGTADAAPTTEFDTLTTGPISTVPLTIGSRASSAEWFAGGIDDVAVYPSALTAARVAVHAQAGKSAAGAVTTTYYSDTAVPANSCAGVAVVGLAKQTTDADPDGTGPAQPIVHQAVYDTLGRPAGNQIAGDANWACTTYDTRGRVGTVTDSAGRQSTNNYNDATTPGTVTQSYTDSAGTARITTAVADLLGRAVSYTDEQGGTTTASYDQTGRQTDTYRAVFGGAQTHLTNTAYDPYNRPATTSEYLSGAARTTTVGYDPQGRPTTATLPNGVITTTSYDADRGYVAGLTNITGGGTHLSDWAYHQSLGAKIDTDTNTGVRTRNYSYDPAGRLTQTVEGAATRRYAYDANTNRCALATACDNTWTYNPADQLTASPQATSYTYNTHGQLTAANRTDGKTENIGYDGNDHATTIDNGTTTTNETLAPSGRVLERKVINDTTHAIVEDTLYGYADTTDNPAYTRAATGGPVTTYLGNCVDIAGTPTWNIQNAHGDIVGTTDNNATYTPNSTTDEFGIGTTPTTRLGYLGGHQRFTTDPNLELIRMGVRLYDPNLGRFLEIDPIEGGSANNYDYVNADPVNGLDLAGTCGRHKGIFGWVRNKACDAASTVRVLGTVALSGYTVIWSHQIDTNTRVIHAFLRNSYGRTCAAGAFVGTFFGNPGAGCLTGAAGNLIDKVFNYINNGSNPTHQSFITRRIRFI